MSEGRVQRPIPTTLLSPDAWVPIIFTMVLSKISSMTTGNGIRGRFSVAHSMLLTGLTVYSITDESASSVVDLRNASSRAGGGASSIGGGGGGKARRRKGKQSTSSRSAASSSADNKPAAKSGSGTSSPLELNRGRIAPGALVMSSLQTVDGAQLWTCLDHAWVLAWSTLVALTSRWCFGLYRTIRSSTVGGIRPSCCATDDPSELLGCKAALQKDDDAASTALSILVALALLAAIGLASVSSRTRPDVAKGSVRYLWPVSSYFAGFFIGVAAFWLSHTPSLLRLLGIHLTEALEEFSARGILFGRLFGIYSDHVSSIAAVEGDDVDDDALPPVLNNLVNWARFWVALFCGVAASSLAEPIRSTARTSAYALSGSGRGGVAAGGARRQKDHAEAFQETVSAWKFLLVVAMQFVSPQLILATYFFQGSYDYERTMQHHSPLFVRTVSAWVLVIACLWTLRSLLQKFLEQAVSVATWGLTADKVEPEALANPFKKHYERLALTASHFSAFPLFLLALLALGHLVGGDARPASARVGVPPAFAGDWAAGGHAPSSRSGWRSTPLRDLAQSRISALSGGKVCAPPSKHAMRAMRVEENKELSDPIMGGRELLTSAPHVRVTFIDVLRNINDFSLLVGDEEEEEGTIVSSLPAKKSGWRGTKTAESPTPDRDTERRRKEGSRVVRGLLESMARHRWITPTVAFPIVNFVSFFICILWTWLYVLYGFTIWVRMKRAGPVPFQFAEKSS